MKNNENIEKKDKHISYLNPVDIPDQYLKKYQKSGPRYTSYPTAPQFKNQFKHEEIKSLWKDSNVKNLKENNDLSIYTHFPFCESRCLYCGCYTQTDIEDKIKEKYIEALKEEISTLFTFLDPSRKVRQFAFGGGTPTSLSPEILKSYINHVEDIVTFADDAERSIEVDPRSVNTDYLQDLVDLKFNRFSFGIQDLNPLVQNYINREMKEEKIRELIDYLQKIGINSINIDLIFGLPGQTPDSFAETVEKILQLKPTRIALFGYAHVPWVSDHQKELEKHSIPTTEERMAIFGKAYDILLSSGYDHIGMDHFALPGDELMYALKNRTLTRNFMGYTTRKGLDLIGIGASSISSVGKTYTQNIKNLDLYLKKDSNDLWNRALILDDEDILRREIILELFCNFYLNINNIEKKYSIDFFSHFKKEINDFSPMITDKLLKIENKEIIVPELGRFFIRNICMVFDQYLANDKKKGDVKYSKTL